MFYCMFYFTCDRSLTVSVHDRRRILTEHVYNVYKVAECMYYIARHTVAGYSSTQCVCIILSISMSSYGRYRVRDDIFCRKRKGLLRCTGVWAT